MKKETLLKESGHEKALKKTVNKPNLALDLLHQAFLISTITYLNFAIKFSL